MGYSLGYDTNFPKELKKILKKKVVQALFFFF